MGDQAAKDRRTESIVMKGEATVQCITEALVSASCWFTIHPLPDQVWRITVKADDMPILRAAMALKKRSGAPLFWPQVR